jgi:hypothetical protein
MFQMIDMLSVVAETLQHEAIPRESKHELDITRSYEAHCSYDNCTCSPPVHFPFRR